MTSNNISSSAKIHSTAIIGDEVILNNNVEIGPYCILTGKIKLESGVKLHSHVCIHGDTTVGSGTEIFPFAVLGYKPQDLKYSNEQSSLIIGSNNIIREHVTMHPGTKGGINKTIVGNDCLFMVGSHVAHDCVIGDMVIMANNAGLAGHVVLENNVIIGGLAGVHQFIKIGKYSMIGGLTAVRENVTPYSIIVGARGSFAGVNTTGMKRANFSKKEIEEVNKIFKKIFFERDSDSLISDRIKEAEQIIPQDSPAMDILNFIKNSESRVCMPFHKTDT
jgi:UDP-N-acetylglucosamine acyltransferase